MDEEIQSVSNEDSLEELIDNADCIVTNIVEAENGN